MVQKFVSGEVAVADHAADAVAAGEVDDFVVAHRSFCFVRWPSGWSAGQSAGLVVC